MDDDLRKVRRLLRESTRKEFEALIYDAMLPPTQENVLRLYICNGISIPRIAERLGYSDSGIRRILKQAYKKVAKL